MAQRGNDKNINTLNAIGGNGFSNTININTLNTIRGNGGNIGNHLFDNDGNHIFRFKNFDISAIDDTIQKTKELYNLKILELILDSISELPIDLAKIIRDY